uniref:uncharacterized protein LOC122586019 isoform X2 n=1 Tax=Erigeron canadensis TaxID=72917 RepID=UPI001CB90A3A|nr:uncharacterized protein LOC122586019 isoform X2 [Erigeron canadensis]
MEKQPGAVDFKVGQLAELRTFQTGYRGAWFRCKILNIIPEKMKVNLQYYDFDQEKPSWEPIYKAPPHGRKTRQFKKQLMLRPRYPPMYHISEVPPAKSISEVCVVINGRWKVGDTVDWYFDSIYWSARVIKVLSDVEVQIELPMPPAGEGQVYDAYCKDLRPFLDWSEREGWTLPTGGETSGNAQLIFPSKQEVENAACSPLNVSSSTRISAEGGSERQSKDVNLDNNFMEGDMKKQSSAHVDTAISEEKVQSEDVKMDDDFTEGDTQEQSSYPVDTVICEKNMQNTDVEMVVDFAVRDTKKQSSDPVDAVIVYEKEQSKDVKMDDEFVLAHTEKQSSDLVHTVMEEKVQCEDVKMNDDGVEESVCAEESAVDECDIDRGTSLNIMHEYTLEAAVTDLEELANKIKWLKAILNNNGNQSTINHTPSWKLEPFLSH